MIFVFCRLLAAPVIVEGDEKTTNSSNLLSAVITAASVEILECLIENSPNSEESSIEYVEVRNDFFGLSALR